MRMVTKRQVRTISRKDHVQAAVVSDDYLYGLIDGEGMFHVGIVPSRFTRLGWQVIYLFKVAQNPIGESVLVALQERLGCGTISPNARAGARDRTLKYVVRDLENLKNRVVPFCEDRLIVKREAFESFKNVLDRVTSGRHLTANGLLEIVDIAYAMNTKVRRVPRATIEAAIQGRGILTGHTPDSL
jgi:LAGLIDADG DNA endonuclease family protein